MDYDVKDINLAEVGKKRIQWADNEMLVLRLIRKRFEEEKPLQGIKMSACLHITTETANLARTLKAGGADVRLCASNPLSTQDDVAASLVKDFEIPVFAIRREDNKVYYEHIELALGNNPQITMDDGGDLISTIHSKHQELIPEILASLEETTTGIIRLRAMEKDGALKVPVFSVNDAQTKHLFDNRYGTGQSTVDGIMRATNILIAGKNVVVAGYGWCGRGVANRVRGLGANVIITEVSPIKALEAVMDGFRVMAMSDAAKIGDIFVTLTGDKSAIAAEHFALMKDGAIVANSGHFNVEIDIPALQAMSKEVNKNVKDYVDEYIQKDGRHIFLLAEGRLINLSAAEGHPASVMDMSFSVQALTSEYVAKKEEKLTPKVHSVPCEIDEAVATLKLKSMGIDIDKLTPEQEKYLSSWSEGT